MRSSDILAIIFLLFAVFLLIAGCVSTAPAVNSSGALDATPAAGLTSVPVPATTGTCIDGLALCSGYCRDLHTDAANCGMCGIKCPAEHTCVGGVCKANDVCSGEGCPVPTPTVSRVLTAGVTSTVPVTSAVTGTITTTTPGKIMTTVATTSLSCPMNQTACAGKCADLLMDNKNCGGCGVVCTAKTYCSAGTCVAWPSISSCSPVEMDCSGKCVNTSNDPNNCGSCGTTCVSGICSDGKCTLPTSAPTIAYTLAPTRGGGLVIP